MLFDSRIFMRDRVLPKESEERDLPYGQGGRKVRVVVRKAHNY